MTEREYELDKTIEFYVRVNYKNERVSALKNPAKAKSTGKNEFLIPASVRVLVPEIDVPEMSSRIEVPQPRVQSAVMESLGEEDFPDWSKTVDRVLADNEELLEDGELGWSDCVDLLTSRAMGELEEFAPFDDVREYVEERAREYRMEVT